MKKLSLIVLLILFACGGFKYVHKTKERIVYLLPVVAEEKAIEHITEIKKVNGDSTQFYVGFEMYHRSVDTFLLTIRSYDSRVNVTSGLYRLVHASNRFVKIGEMHLPIVNVQDYWFSSITNTKNLDGSISLEIPSGKYYSIIFTGRFYKKGNLIWAGWAGG